MKIPLTDRLVVFHAARCGLRKWLLPILKHPHTLTVHRIGYLKYPDCGTYMLLIDFSAHNDRGAPCPDSLFFYADRGRIYRRRSVRCHTGTLSDALPDRDLERLNTSI